MSFQTNFIEVVEKIIDAGCDPSPLCATLVLSFIDDFTKHKPILFGSTALYWVRLLSNHPVDKIVSLYIKNPPSDIDIMFTIHKSYLTIIDILSCSINLLPGIKLVETLSRNLSSRVPKSIAVSKLKLNFNLKTYLKYTNSFLCNPILKHKSMINFNFDIDLVFIKKFRDTYRFLDEIFEVNLKYYTFSSINIEHISNKPDRSMEEELLTSVKITKKISRDFNYEFFSDKVYIDKFTDFNVLDQIINELDLGNRYLLNKDKLPIGITCEQLITKYNFSTLVDKLSLYWINCQTQLLSQLKLYKKSLKLIPKEYEHSINTRNRSIKNIKELITSHWALQLSSHEDIKNKTSEIIKNIFDEGVYSLSEISLIDIKDDCNKRKSIGILSCGHSIILDDILDSLETELREISRHHSTGYRKTELNKAVLCCPLCRDGKITNISSFFDTEEKVLHRLHNKGSIFMTGDDLQQIIRV